MSSDNVPGIGVGALIIRERRVLLVQRDVAPHAGMWTVPGGKLEWGETLAEAAVREVREETAVTVSAGAPVYLLQLLAVSSGYHYVIIDLLCHYQRGEPVAGSDVRQAAWISLDALSGVPVEAQTLRMLELQVRGALPEFNNPIQEMTDA